MGASIGIAIAGPTDDADALIRYADLAMYDAKSRAKNRSSFYRPEAVLGDPRPTRVAKPR